MTINEVWYEVVTARRSPSPESAASRKAAPPGRRSPDAGLLEAVERNTVEVRLAAGSHLFRQGETADRLFVIRRGRVALELPAPRGRRRRVATVRSGEFLGRPWAVPPDVWPYDGRALEPTVADAVDPGALRAALLARARDEVRFRRPLLSSERRRASVDTAPPFASFSRADGSSSYRKTPPSTGEYRP
jgi:hypothetical protein